MTTSPHRLTSRIARIARIARANMLGKDVRPNISHDEGLPQAIDATAQPRGMTRSGFLAEAAKRAIQNQA